MLMSNNEHTTEFQNNTFGQLPENRLSVYTPEYAKDMRIDKFLSLNYTFFSRAKIQELIKKGKVKVNHKTIQTPSYRITPPQKITIDPLLEKTFPLKKELPPIIFEDDYIIGLDKPANLIVHPAPNVTEYTLVDILLKTFPSLIDIGPSHRAGIIHRLDKNTSGIILIAKSNDALTHLSKQFKNRKIKKQYIALIDGHPNEKKAIINAPLGRNPTKKSTVSITNSGKPSITTYKVLKTYPQHSLVEVFPKSGRTHQIRVHFSAIGHPIAGDTTYGSKTKIDNRHFLHAKSIEFLHPNTLKKQIIETNIPSDLNQILLKINDV